MSKNRKKDVKNMRIQHDREFEKIVKRVMDNPGTKVEEQPNSKATPQEKHEQQKLEEQKRKERLLKQLNNLKRRNNESIEKLSTLERHISVTSVCAPQKSEERLKDHYKDAQSYTELLVKIGVAAAIGVTATASIFDMLEVDETVDVTSSDSYFRGMTAEEESQEAMNELASDYYNTADGGEI